MEGPSLMIWTMLYTVQFSCSVPSVGSGKVSDPWCPLESWGAILGSRWAMVGEFP